jgi:hypothetical protein
VLLGPGRLTYRVMGGVLDLFVMVSTAVTARR